MGDSPDGNIIYHGDRGNKFKELLTSVLSRGGLKPSYLSSLLDENGLKVFSDVFTAASADTTHNYEYYEQLGDVTANKFIVWYAYRRFPQLKCPLGVKVVARLRINYGARASFSTIGDRLGFWDFISASEEARSRRKKDLLEDCLEAFCGATESILDEKYRQGVGNAIVYDILKSIFDEMPISLHYNHLYDAKTRLKELFDAYKEQLGSWSFSDTRDDKLCTSQLFINKNELIGLGIAGRKGDAQQKAAEAGLQYLSRRGFVKNIPPEYAAFAT